MNARQTASLPPLKPGDDVLAVSRVSGKIRLHAVRVSRVWVSLGGTMRVEGVDLKGERPARFVGDRRQCIRLDALENLSPAPATARRVRHEQMTAASAV